VSITVIPGLILGVLISIPFSMLTGMAGARYRDLLQLFTNNWAETSYFAI
jgi:ABC-type polysaccharide/polyol phosphate export permease